MKIIFKATTTMLQRCENRNLAKTRYLLSGGKQPVQITAAGVTQPRVKETGASTKRKRQAGSTKPVLTY